MLAVGEELKLTFDVNSEMVKSFARLSGDFSSLHTNPDFARRSMYRDTVVHGVLPVLFLAALPLPDGLWRPESLSARFIHPVFPGEQLLLSAMVDEVSEGKDNLKLDYELRLQRDQGNLSQGRIATVGSVLLRKDGATLETAVKEDMSVGVLSEPLEETVKYFHEIERGDQALFSFQLLPAQAFQLGQILEQGLGKGFRPQIAPEWLAVSLFSTFVGMCIPGRYATFMDFQADFSRPLQWGTEYCLDGEVRFASASTRTLIESLNITEVGDDEPAVRGKVSTRVNRPPAEMPSMQSLMQEHTSLGLEGKVVLVTGASRGLGETTAKLLALHGAKVVVNYNRGAQDANRVVNEILKHNGEALAVQADVSVPEHVRKMVSKVVEEYDHIDILVNNAVRSYTPAAFLDLSWEEVQKDFEVVVKGAFLCIQAVIPGMIAQGGGKIINMSTLAVEAPPQDQAKYVIAKSALVGLTRSLAVELASHNIQVNMVAPGFVETDLTRGVSEIAVSELKRSIPMGRTTAPEDVAKAIIFLASDLASFTTGQQLMVTGGELPFL